MLVQYDGYITRTVYSLRYSEMVQDVFLGDRVIGAYGRTFVTSEPKTVKGTDWVILEYGGNVTTIHVNTYVKMEGGKWIKAKHIKVHDKLDNNVRIEYVGRTKQALYGTKVDTEDHTLVVNGLTLKGAEHD